MYVSPNWWPYSSIPCISSCNSLSIESLFVLMALSNISKESYRPVETEMLRDFFDRESETRHRFLPQKVQGNILLRTKLALNL